MLTNKLRHYQVTESFLRNSLSNLNEKLKKDDKLQILESALNNFVKKTEAPELKNEQNNLLKTYTPKHDNLSQRRISHLESKIQILENNYSSLHEQYSIYVNSCLRLDKKDVEDFETNVDDSEEISLHKLKIKKLEEQNNCINEHLASMFAELKECKLNLYKSEFALKKNQQKTKDLNHSISFLEEEKKQYLQILEKISNSWSGKSGNDQIQIENRKLKTLYENISKCIKSNKAIHDVNSSNLLAKIKNIRFEVIYKKVENAENSKHIYATPNEEVFIKKICEYKKNEEKKALEIKNLELDLFKANKLNKELLGTNIKYSNAIMF